MKTNNIPKHDCTSYGHLTRVLDLLTTRDTPPRNYFYAAYELRCGIEARLKQYLSVQKDLPKKLKKGWRIAVLGKGTEQLFKTRDHILRFKMTNTRTRKACVLLYTPVGRDLHKMGEQLGNFLHNLWDEDTSSLEWWDNFRTLVADATAGLFRANVGTLLGPPLVRDEGKEMQIAHNFSHQEATDAYLEDFGGNDMFDISSSWYRSFSEFDVYEIFNSRLTPYFRSFSKWIGKEESHQSFPPYAPPAAGVASGEV